MEKPLFIPLKTEFYQAFKEGRKTEEYRLYGPRWNERTCRVGRRVVLSHGYQVEGRLHGVITGFSRSTEVTETEAWEKCYGEKEGEAACIAIHVGWWTDPATPAWS